MAETLISPGVLARENDQSQITSQPVQAGAAIVGPAVLGRVGVPRLVTSYSEYLANYGSTFTSGSDTYTYFTSISAYNYFQNGGTSLLVTRIASGSWSPATSTLVPALESESSVLEVARNLSGSSMTGTGFVGTAATVNGVVTTVSPAGGTGLTLNTTTGVSAGKLVVTADALLAEFQAGSDPSDLGENAGYTLVPITQGANTSGQATVVVGTDSKIGSITVTTPGTGYTAGAISIAAGALGTGQLITGAITSISVLSGGTTLGTDSGPFTFSQGAGGYAVTGGSQQTGNLATIIVTGDGAGSLSTVAVANQGTNFVDGNILTITAADLVTAGFGGCDQNLVITLGASNVQNSSAATATLTNADLLVEIEDAVVNAGGTGYAVGNTITVAGALLTGGAATPANNVTFVLTNQDLVDTNVFTLETISEGDIMNSVGPESTNGALASGSAQNVRWEIQAPNSGSGVFSLIVRQGNDNSKSKSILEVFPNVSLDPKQSNYISRIVGDMTETLKDATTSEPYLQSTGSFRNASRYVRVKDVNLKTPNYFDNSGIAKAEFTGSLPEASSGSFEGAEGSNIGDSSNINLFYQDISDSNSQGMTSTEMGSVKGGYATAFNLLGNKDDYRFNILTAPGLYKASSTYSTPLNIALSTVQSRGDAILLMDLVDYGSSITTVTSQASSVDNSYAAAYWPWVQINDPDSAQLVWAPASALIPGVYAYNDKAAEAWFAPAGINRGGLSTVVQAERKLTQTNRDDLYTGKVNPIATFPGRGVVVFGQKTLQSQASALDRVNVRRLLIELKSYISQIADNLVFEQNTAATRNNFLAQVNPYLESVQQRQGLYAFKVVMDASNNGPDVIDRNQMVGAIYLQPTKTAEFIYLDFNILPTGAEFPS